MMLEYLEKIEIKELNKMMTRKHFVILANAFNRMDLTPEQLDIVIEALHKTNPRFNEHKFRKAVYY